MPLWSSPKNEPTMKLIYAFIFISVLGLNRFVYAQNKSPLSSASIKKLEAHQDTLKEFAYYLNTDSLTEDRMIADSQFTRTLVRALQISYSFYYSFDSVKGVAKLYAPDSSFRIITWNLQYDDYYCRQRGDIQINTKNGALKLFPLVDYSTEIKEKDYDSVYSNTKWFGCLYYNIIQKEIAGQNVYFL